MSFFVIKNDTSDIVFQVVSNILTLLNSIDKFGEDCIIIDDFCELREMPREPLLQSHTKSINVLVKLLYQSYRLDDGLVLPVHVRGALGPREAVAQTELRLPDVFFLNLCLVCLKREC